MDDKPSLKGRGQVRKNFKFWGSNYMSGTAEARFVKIVVYICRVGQLSALR